MAHRNAQLPCYAVTSRSQQYAFYINIDQQSGLCLAVPAYALLSRIWCLSECHLALKLQIRTLCRNKVNVPHSMSVMQKVICLVP